jgi:hypothetical protein
VKTAALPLCVLVTCALAALLYRSTSAGCPASPTVVRVDFFGDVIGSGEIKLTPARWSAFKVAGTVSRGGAVIVKFDGAGACKEGVIGATFQGAALSQAGVKIEDGKFAAIFNPRPLGGRLAGSWDAVIVHNNGVSRAIHGFVRDERAVPVPGTATSTAATR